MPTDISQAMLSSEIINQGEDDSSTSGLVLKQWEKYHIMKPNFQMQLNLHLTQQAASLLALYSQRYPGHVLLHLFGSPITVLCFWGFSFVFPLIFLGLMSSS